MHFEIEFYLSRQDPFSSLPHPFSLSPCLSHFFPLNEGRREVHKSRNKNGNVSECLIRKRSSAFVVSGSAGTRGGTSGIPAIEGDTRVRKRVLQLPHKCRIISITKHVARKRRRCVALFFRPLRRIKIIVDNSSSTDALARARARFRAETLTRAEK